MKKATSNMTLEKLASEMQKGFKRQDANLEKLAMMVANGFARVDERFEQVDTRVSHIEKSLQTIRGELLKQNDRFVSQDTFNTQISALEAKVKIKAK